MLPTLGRLLVFISLVRADTCATVRVTAPSVDIVRQLHPTCTTTLSDYWSTSCAALKPSCILFPSKASEVSAILKILSGGNNTEHFAIKSGGHNPNNYWSSVAGGPLISTDQLDHVIFDSATGTVRIGPGNRWTNVAQALDGSGWSVVGGRISDVGVGGYLVGGGLSFMSGQYGWATDSVLDIVTSFSIQAYRQGDVFGGVMVFPQSENTDARLIAAIRDFTVYNKDDKAALILTAVRSAVELIDTWFIFTFYDGSTPSPGIFKNFTDIGPVVNTGKTRSYADLVIANWATVRGSIYMIGTETVPMPPPSSDVNVLKEIHAH